MAKSYQGKTGQKKESRSYPKPIRLFFKQAIASLVFGIFFFLMHALPVSQLNNCADALGRALRHEYTFPAQKLTDWVKERIPLP